VAFVAFAGEDGADAGFEELDLLWCFFSVGHSAQ
jgi:hypothetical protein